MILFKTAQRIERTIRRLPHTAIHQAEPLGNTGYTIDKTITANGEQRPQ
jgi:hypothetical protein